MSEPPTIPCWAIVNHRPGQAKKSKQHRGLPPELTGGIDYRVELPWADVIIVTAEPETGYLLDRYTKSGEWINDTWHETLDSALNQAAFEYEGIVSEWRSVPEGVDDIATWVLAQVSDE